MSHNQKNNENDLNELYNRLKNMDRKKVDETLEYLDKGSPKLNWLYITLAVAIIFLLIWLIMVMNPNEDVAPTIGRSEEINLQIQEMETRIESLESQVESIEEANN
ncbi:Uncharacterised protein [Aerococcus viridans]|uniref:Uncharacterized protein n=2 Tax=Aerococcus viridans TaxID=1377 RepID=A0AAU8U5T4_9LACT|nr:hypothetical protein [Aerococcus viridans]AMC01515.1 hypothetical protein AWM76_08095 [Aerococcus viridans]EFG49344.1 hypothetical protein HMPREF0061_1325 [Aerococcus viridans ATCC 11563 = CCUG 4311]SPT62439.1 Uncharacterised protein [Aerococcus viridans]SUU14720.1 Uncharacterised protein [Aerococcus viridans]